MNEFTQLISQSKPTLVDFFATWCGPCRMQGPIVEELKARVGDTANIIKVDIDKNRRLAAEYNVRSVPTLIVFRDGKIVWRETGLHTIEALEAALNPYL